MLFRSMRSQCYYKLASVVNNRTISVPVQSAELRDQIVSELEQIKAKDHDKDGKLQIVPKDEIKEKISKSPDLADNLMMRMWFEFAPVPRIYQL